MKYDEERRNPPPLETTPNLGCLKTPEFEVQKQLGIQSLDVGKYQDSIGHFSCALKLDPKSPEIFAWRGIAYCISKKYLQAAKDLSFAIRNDFDDLFLSTTVYHYNEMTVAEMKKLGLFLSRDVGLFIRPFVECLKMSDQNNSEFFYCLGILYSRLKQYNKAVENFDVAVKLKPKDSFVLCHRGRALWRKGSHEKSYEDAMRANELDPKNVVSVLQQGTYLSWIKRDYKSAIVLFTKGIELDPTCALCYVGRAICYKNGFRDEKSPDGNPQHFLELAIKDYDMGCKLKPHFSIFFYNRGNAHSAMNNYPQAMKDYTRAIELNSNDLDAYHNLGLCHISLNKDYESAISCFADALKINPKGYSSLLDMGRCYHKTKKLDEAVKCITRAIKVQPKNPDAYFSRGNVFGRQGKFELAVKDLTKVIELKPKFANAYRMRATCFRDMKKFKLVLKDLHEAVKVDPEDYKSYNSLGKTYKISALGENSKEKEEEKEKFLMASMKYYSLSVKYGAAAGEREGGHAARNRNRLLKALKEKKKNQKWTEDSRFMIEFLTEGIELTPQWKEGYLERAKYFQSTKRYVLAAIDILKTLFYSTSSERFWKSLGLRSFASDLNLISAAPEKMIQVFCCDVYEKRKSRFRQSKIRAESRFLYSENNMNLFSFSSGQRFLFHLSYPEREEYEEKKNFACKEFMKITRDLLHCQFCIDLDELDMSEPICILSIGHHFLKNDEVVKNDLRNRTGFLRDELLDENRNEVIKLKCVVKLRGKNGSSKKLLGMGLMLYSV